MNLINELRRLAQAAMAAPDGLSVEWMDRLGQFQEAADASVVSELIDRLEAAEKEVESWKGLAQQFGNEADALRAKIAEMEKQEPVAFALYSGLSFKAAYQKEHEACDQRDRRQLSADLGGSLEAYRVVPLYALPSAQTQGEWK